MGPQGADLKRLDREFKVIARGGGAGEVKHAIDGPRQIKVLGDVVLDAVQVLEP
jgi:hypothetical protein